MHDYFSVLKIQFGQQTFWGKQGIKSTIHKVLLICCKKTLISGLTRWSGEKIQTQITFFRSGWNIPCWITGRSAWTFTHSSSWDVHQMLVNLEINFTLIFSTISLNCSKSHGAVAFKISKLDILHEICLWYSKMLLFAVHSKDIYPLLFAVHSKHI